MVEQKRGQKEGYWNRAWRESGFGNPDAFFAHMGYVHGWINEMLRPDNPDELETLLKPHRQSEEFFKAFAKRVGYTDTGAFERAYEQGGTDCLAKELKEETRRENAKSAGGIVYVSSEALRSAIPDSGLYYGSMMFRRPTGANVTD